MMKILLLWLTSLLLFSCISEVAEPLVEKKLKNPVDLMPEGAWVVIPKGNEPFVIMQPKTDSSIMFPYPVLVKERGKSTDFLIAVYANMQQIPLDTKIEQNTFYLGLRDWRRIEYNEKVQELYCILNQDTITYQLLRKNEEGIAKKLEAEKVKSYFCPSVWVDSSSIDDKITYIFYKEDFLYQKDDYMSLKVLKLDNGKLMKGENDMQEMDISLRGNIAFAYIESLPLLGKLFIMEALDSNKVEFIEVYNGLKRVSWKRESNPSQRILDIQAFYDIKTNPLGAFDTIRNPLE